MHEHRISLDLSIEEARVTVPTEECEIYEHS
jgi:hypothetical protein